MNSHAEPFHPNPNVGGQNQPKGNTASAPGNSHSHPKFGPLPKGQKCYHCQKRGQVMADCWYLKGANQGSTKPTTMTVKAYASTVPETVLSNLTHPAVPQEYKPFLFCGYVGLPDSRVEKPIMILRDTGANQSLLLEGTLPLSEQTSTAVDVLIQGVEVEPISVPLHRVTLQSDLVPGTVTVGIRPSLPVVGVEFILGNDLAGGKKVSTDPRVTSTPVCHDEANEHVKIYPACAVTRARAKANKWRPQFVRDLG